MAVSGTTTFEMNLTEVCEEAWERAGREMRSGYDLRTARRSLNLLLIEWGSRGLQMWTFEEGTVNLEQGVLEYDLPADTVDLLEHVIRTGGDEASTQQDLSITRISVSTYATIPNKLVQGRPIQIYIERLRDNPVIKVWPVPDQGTDDDPYYVLKYWRMRRMDDAGTGVNTPDIVYRFYPALVAGLAYYIALKTPELFERVEMLKMEYDRLYDIAAGEDREKSSVRLVPYLQWGGLR